MKYLACNYYEKQALYYISRYKQNIEYIKNVEVVNIYFIYIYK